MLGLPNSTSYTKYQDQLYHEFKVKTSAKTNAVFADKLAARNYNIKTIKKRLRSLGLIQNWSEYGNLNADMTPYMKVVLTILKNIMKTPRIANNDLSATVNDTSNTSPSLSSFLQRKTRLRVRGLNKCRESMQNR